MNWDRINNEANSASGQQDTKTNTYLKFTSGQHYVRLLPAGNKEEDLPYKTYQTHSIPVGSIGGGQQQIAYILCWNWLFSSQDCIEVNVKGLGRMQKITKPMVQLYQKHGCPVCNTALALDAAGCDSKIVNQLKPKVQHIWNAVMRPKTNADPVTCKVWTMSNKLHKGLLTGLQAYHKAGFNALDIEGGYDILVSATGEGLNRRYDGTMWFPQPKPLGYPNIIPFNLFEVMANNFKPYQESINLMKQHYGKVLAGIGYEIPGDTANIADSFGEVYPNAQNLQNAVGIPTNNFGGEMTSPFPQQTQQPQQQHRPDSTLEDDGLEMQGGFLVDKKTGLKLF